MKKNEKGFTLIELLAVIVILAIIALITTPIVISSINTAREGAAKDSAYGVLKAVSEGYLESQINGSSNITSEYSFESNASNSFTVTISGTKPSGGEVSVTNDKVTIKDEKPLIINGYRCTGSSDEVSCTKQP